METEMNPQAMKLWTRRLTLHPDDLSAEFLLEQLCPPAYQAEEEDVRKSRPPSPSPPCSQTHSPKENGVCECRASSGLVELDGATLGDVPCKYAVPRPEPHEMAAVGVFIDPRIVPGFKYNIRIITRDGKKQWMFGGQPREVASLGRGYSRRVTLTPLPGHLNHNPDYFWTDSAPDGFAFSVSVVAPGDKFTVFDANHQPVGNLEIIENQGPQTQVSQRCVDGTVENTVRVRALCSVEWFHEQDPHQLIPVSGLAVSVRTTGGVVTRVVDARLGSHPRRGFSLAPGVCHSLRSLRLSSTDIPTCYTIVGLDRHHIPIIGTYVDERIVTGFYYRVRVAGGGMLWGGRPLRLDSIGRGYAKRLTFAPDRLNHPENHFWSDSHPEGFGLEHAAVRPGMTFQIRTEGRPVGTATVFRDDCGPQVELHHSLVEEEGEVSIVKKVHVDVKCEVSLDVGGKEQVTPHIMRVNGTAILSKTNNNREAKVLRIEDIGLDSQLNVIVNQWPELVLHPIEKQYC